MRSIICLAAFAAFAWTLPAADAQPRSRDHRSSDDAGPRTRDHRSAPDAPTIRSVEPKRGAPGTEVTIRGRDFPDRVRVMIGGERVRPDRVSSRSITFTVPELSAGNQAITLVRRRDEIATAGDFRVRPAEQARARRGKGADKADKDDKAKRRDRRDRAADRRPGRRDHRSPVVSSFGPQRGPAGTEVTIRGRHFGDDVRVYYDGRRVRGASVSPSRITFEIPSRGEDEGDIALRREGTRGDIVVGTFEIRDRTRARAERGERRAERERRARERWRERRRGLPETVEERRQRLEEEEEKLRRTRAERRSERAARMRAQFEREFLALPQVRAELTLHAERSARLQRMLRLAEADDHDRLVVRIEVLIDREDERHERRMATLRRQLL